MEQSNNKKRLLALIEILKKNTNANKHISLSEIISLLEKEDIYVNNRKTIYDDIRILNDFDINVEYENGYYLIDAPFNLSEIKIVIDSINSLKNLDNRFLDDLKNKLYSFISYDEEKLLNRISYTTKHKDTKLLQHMEDILEAITNNTAIIVKDKKDKENEIYPIYLHRQNDYYYFYYHYLDSKNIYHYRFDNIKDIKLTDKKDTLVIQKKEIDKHIESSSNSFSKGKGEQLEILLDTTDSYLKSRFIDDFPNAIETKKGFSIIADINNIFYAKLCAYGNKVKIANKKVAKDYYEYLKSIIDN